MKIVHLIGYFQPEFGYKEYYIARSQAKLGHDVHVVTSDRIYPFPNLAELAQSIQLSRDRKRPAGTTVLDEFHVHRLPALFELRGAILLRGLGSILGDLRPELVHAYEPAQFAPALAGHWKKSVGYRLFADSQQFTLPGTVLGRLYYRLFARRLGQYLFDRADRVLICTQESKTFALAHYRLAQEKIAMIPLGYDEEIFQYDKSSRQRIRGSLGLNDSDTLLVTAGKIQRFKRYEIVLDALASISQIQRPVFLIIGSGDGRYLDELKNRAQALGIQKNVLFHNFLPARELAGYYSASDIGIWPEQPSITILEAIGCSLPVIVPNRGTVRHLISFGNGRTFQPGDSHDLRSAIVECITKPQELAEMRRRAATHAGPAFSYRHIAQSILALAH